MVPHFESKGVDSPRIVAEMVLAHVLDCERMRLYMEVDRPATTPEREILRSLVARASRHEPVQYLVGEAWFYGKPYFVDPSTLIPRPSTETLVDAVLKWHEERDETDPPLIVDVGTGTGCVAITLALQLEQAQLVATDVSEAALALARRNAERHGVAERIDFRLGSLLEPLATPPVHPHVIVSNPPYIPDHEWAEVAPNVKQYEPESALRGGVDGLAYIRPLVLGAGPILPPGGFMAIEIADCQRDEALAMAASVEDLASIEVLKDHELLHRVLTAKKSRNRAG